MYRLAFDYSAAIDPATISGVEGVCRYLGGPNALTRAEVDAHHAAGRWVLPTFETAADEAEHPERGAADGAAAQAALGLLGAPPGVGCAFTDDHNDNDPAQERAYMAGVAGAFSAPKTIYGSKSTIEACLADGVTDAGWGVGTWGFGEGPDTLPIPIPGVVLMQLADPHDLGQPADAAGSTDVNLVYADVPGAWYPPGHTPQQEEPMFPRLVNTPTQIVLIDAEGEIIGLTGDEIGAYQRVGVPGPFAVTDADLALIQGAQKRLAAQRTDTMDALLTGRAFTTALPPLPPNAPIERRRTRAELLGLRFGKKP